MIMVQDWRRIQLNNITSWEKLAQFLGWHDIDKEKILKKSSFPLNLPLRLAQKAEKKTLNDPILKQFLPSLEELVIHPGFSKEPVQDATFRKNESALLQKYEGRALLITSGACAMHCRYCFRKNFDYTATKDKTYQAELDIIRQTPSIKEIILSGGDPLSQSNETLKKLLTALDGIEHVRRIRFHTRFPIGIPERINDEFLEILSSLKKQVFFVIHPNHVNELDADIYAAMKNIRKLGIPVLTQSVLMRGVNDSVRALQDLFEALSDNGIVPYYIHQLDPVQGAAHFEVPEEEGKRLMKELSTKVSGYNLPKYAKEVPGKPSKTLIHFF